MKKTVLAMFAFVFVLVASSAQAQVSYYGKAQMSRQAYIDAIATCDGDKLTKPCSEIVRDVNQMFPSFKIADPRGLGAHWNRLPVKPCPLPIGGECLYEDNVGVMVAMLSSPAVSTPAPVRVVPQAPQRQVNTRLRAFMKAGPMTSPKEYADRIRACAKNPIFNTSCQEFLDSFNREFKDAPGIGAMESIEELAKFFEEETVIVSCGTGRAIIAGVNATAKVEYIERPFAFGEMCFQHIATGVKISSAGCGQWIRQILHPTFKTEKVVFEPGIVDQSQRMAENITPERDYARQGGGKFLGMGKKGWVTTGITAAALAALAAWAASNMEVTSCGVCPNGVRK